MTTIENTMVIVANTRTELEKKIANFFSNGHKPMSEVIENKNGEFQIELTF
jgi:hypothetical protein